MKKAISLVLAMLMLLSVAAFAGDTDETSGTAQSVLRTVWENDFDEETVGTLPSVFGGWTTNGIDRSVAAFGDGKAIHMKATYAENKRPDNVLQLQRSFAGKYRIDFQLWVESADQIYITAKTDTNGNAWMDGMYIKNNGEVSFQGNSQNPDVTVSAFALQTWHDISIELDATARTYSYYVDTVPYIKDAAVKNNFDFDNVMFRVQEYGNTVEKTSELYIDNFSVKRYDTAPVITLKGAQKMKVMQGKTFTDPGCSATDVIDGDITKKVTVTGEVDTETPGTYTLSYDVTAKDGTKAETVQREVTVAESVIKGLRVKKEENLENVKVDDRPTETTECFADGGVNKVVEHGGGKALYMKAFANANKNTNVCWAYTVSDVENPVFSMDFEMESFGDAFQIVFKDVSAGKMKTVAAVDASGTLKLFDAATNTKLKTGVMYNLIFEVNSKAKTVNIYLDGEKKLENHALEWSSDNKNMLWRIQLYNFKKNVDVAAYVDNLMIMTAQKPVIKLNGDAEMQAVRGEAFTDPGCTATDVIDGNITKNVTVTGEVDINKEGTYTLSYDVTAKDGTKAETVQRKVTVKKKQIIKDAVITADSEQAGFEASKVADEDANSAWKSASQSPSLVLDFGKETLLETVKIHHSGVTAVDVFQTADGTTWKKADFKTNATDGVLTLTADVFAAKSIKLCFSGTDTAVYEIQADTKDESVAAYVLTAAEETLPAANDKIYSDIALKSDYGFGAAVQWESSEEAVLTNAGKVIPPETDTAVTLTAKATYAQSTATKTFGPFTVRSKTYGLRTVVDEDMEQTAVGSTPVSADDSWGNNGASVGVAQYGSGKALYLQAPFKGESNADATVAYVISNVADPTISFDFAIEEPGKTFQALIKDLTNNKFISFLAVENGAVKFCGQSVGTVKTGEPHNVKYELNFADKTVNAYLDGEQKLTNAVFTDKNVDASNIEWRIQLYNYNKGSELSAYVDNFKVQTNSLPTVTLKGDTELSLYAGSAFVDPGYTATDVVDGNITERVVVSNLPDMNTPGTYRVKYMVSAEDGTESEAVYRTVHVVDPNLLSAAVLTSETAGVEKLIDGDAASTWTSASDATFTAAFSKAVLADTFTLTQNGLGISETLLSYTTDGKIWKPIDADIDYSGSQITATFDPIAVKLFRCTVKGTNIAVTDAKLSVQSANVVKADGAKLSIVSSTAGETIVLPKSGTYGSKITWKSSDESVIANNGSVLQPKESCTVVMTATLQYMDASTTKTYSVAVSGKGGGAGVGNGGAGGGGNRGNGGSTVAATVTGTVGAPNDIPLVPNAQNGAENSVYPDVAAEHWAYDYIESLTKSGVISGTAEGKFEPERRVTRAEYLKMLLSAVELPQQITENPFGDVARDAWYADYVLSAYGNEIVSGMGDGVFAPELGISRQDMAVMTVRALEKAGISAMGEARTAFADEGSIADYAKDSVTMLSTLGILGGDENGNFSPNGSLTRAEAAKVIAMIANIAK